LLRSTRFTFQLLLAVLAVSASAEVACSTQATSGDATEPSSPLQDTGSTSGSPPRPVADAAAGTKLPPYRGNPLCHADPRTCMPDDDGEQRSHTNLECATATPDASQGGTPSKGCRIARDAESQSIAPRCFPNAEPSGRDGTSCEIGEDCAPGFDCVAEGKGVKTCRHYCCGGTCKGNPSNGSPTFCDVQSLVDVPQKAPVCMPLKRCSKLLATGECGANESCTVVTEEGDTGCVVVGDKQVGESCDESHCAAKLACLGQPGARNCFKLCKVTASDCPGSQSCVTSAAFQDTDFGICQ
jgi:hypothetical protein